MKTSKAFVALVVIGLVSMGTVGAADSASIAEKNVDQVTVPEIQAGNIGCPGLPLVSPVVLLLLNHQVEDVYCLEANGGDIVTIHADTTDPVTTHDLWAGICPGNLKTFTFGQCAFFDDQVACTFPPPAYACPRGTVSIGATGSYTVFVGSWGVWGGAHAGPYLYELSVDVNGSPAMLDLNSFDQSQTGP